MNWADELLQRLAADAGLGYHAATEPATEPTALAALALIAWGRAAEAQAKLQWLASLQAADGSLGTGPRQPAPAWPTPLAVLAWMAGNAALDNSPTSLPRRPPWSRHVRAAVHWLLNSEGKKTPSRGEGHDTQLVGWPWVLGTHSWVEPTALAVLALKATGYGSHPRTREAVRLLIDRLLPDGGCNYGNTIVLGQQLVPHVQPTGLALMALAGERDDSGRVARSVRYLRRVLDQRTAPASLAYGLLGMNAQGAALDAASPWLPAAACGAMKHQSPLEMALLLLAAKGPSAWERSSPSRAKDATRTVDA